MMIELRNDLRRIWREPVFWLVPLVLAVVLMLPLRPVIHETTVQTMVREAKTDASTMKLDNMRNLAQGNKAKTADYHAAVAESNKLQQIARRGDRVAYAKSMSRFMTLEERVEGTAPSDFQGFHYLAKHSMPIYFYNIERQREPVLKYLGENLGLTYQSMFILVILAVTVAYLIWLPQHKDERAQFSLVPRRPVTVQLAQAAAVFISVSAAFIGSIVLASLVPLVRNGFGQWLYPIVHNTSEQNQIFAAGPLVLGQILLVIAFVFLMTGIGTLVLTLRPTLVTNVVVQLVFVLGASLTTTNGVAPQNLFRFLPSTYVWTRGVMMGSGSMQFEINAFGLVGGLLVLGVYGCLALGLAGYLVHRRGEKLNIVSV